MSSCSFWMDVDHHKRFLVKNKIRMFLYASGIGNKTEAYVLEMLEQHEACIVTPDQAYCFVHSFASCALETVQTSHADSKTCVEDAAVSLLVLKSHDADTLALCPESGAITHHLQMLSRMRVRGYA